MKHLPLLSILMLATSLSAVAQSSFDNATPSLVAPSSRTDFTVSATGTSSTTADVVLSAPSTTERQVNISTPPPAVPEPATFALIGVGIATLVAAKRRRSTI